MKNDIFLTTDLSIVPDAAADDMLFSDFYQIYYSDMEGRLKPTTLARKHAVVCDKILPTFGPVSMKDISPQMIRLWQTNLLGQGYRDTYLKTIDMHLSSILKYGHTYYGFPNPYAKADHMGTGAAETMRYWTPQEYQQFIRVCSNQPKVFLAFELLYWCGIRAGELLALTPGDMDEKKMLLKITKTYSRHDGRDVISTPKTENSVRNVAMPNFLFREVTSYIAEGALKKNERLIPHSVAFLSYHLRNGCEKSGVKQIRIHDIRHSHVSLLINQGFSAIAIAERVGHKHISTTMNVYAHLFPNRQKMLVDALSAMHDNGFHTFQKKESGHA